MLLLAATIGSLGVLVHPWYDPTYIDASMYIGTARSLAAGEGYQYLGAPFHLRPPGFSVLIAPIIALFGTNFYALNLSVSLLGLAGVLFLYAHARTRLHWTLAVLLSLLVWLQPTYRQLCNSVLSDVPGAAAMLGCLWLDRWAARSGHRRDWVLGVCIAGACYLRTINLMLLPAVLLSRLLLDRARGSETPFPPLRVRLRSALLVSAIALVALLPWFVSNSPASGGGPADQTRNYSYGTVMFHTDVGDPSRNKPLLQM